MWTHSCRHWHSPCRPSPLSWCWSNHRLRVWTLCGYAAYHVGRTACLQQCGILPSWHSEPSSHQALEGDPCCWLQADDWIHWSHGAGYLRRRQSHGTCRRTSRFLLCLPLHIGHKHVPVGWMDCHPKSRKLVILLIQKILRNFFGWFLQN